MKKKKKYLITEFMRFIIEKHSKDLKGEVLETETEEGSEDEEIEVSEPKKKNKVNPIPQEDENADADNSDSLLNEAEKLIREYENRISNRRI
jgi:hypothetical protein